MHLLHVVPTYFPAVRYGGPIYSVHALCRALAARGHDVHVYTTNVDGSGNLNVSLEHPVVIDGVNVRYFPCGIGRRFYRSPAMGEALAANIHSFDFLHLHSVFLWPTLAAARAAAGARVPYFLAPRGMLVPDLIARKSRLAKIAWIRLFERANIQGAAAIHVTSELERVELVKLGMPPRPTILVGNGIDMPGPEQPDWRSTKVKDRFVLSLGRINWKKGLDRILRAMNFLPNISLVIAGNDEENLQPRLEQMAREIGLADRVHFIGPVYGEDKWNLMRSASVFAMPSHSENFGLVALEALACHCPVVLTPEAGVADAICRAGAGIVVNGEPREISDAIARIIENPSLRSEMGRAGAALVSRDYSWSRIAEEMERSYLLHREADRNAVKILN